MLFWSVCELSDSNYLCDANVRYRRDNDPSDDILARSYASKTLDTRQRALENDDDEIKRFLKRDRSPGSANSNFEVAGDWPGVFDGQSGAETRNVGSYPSSIEFPDVDGQNERLEEPRQRRKASRKSNLLDPTYMMMGIGRRRR